LDLPGEIPRYIERSSDRVLDPTACICGDYQGRAAIQATAQATKPAGHANCERIQNAMRFNEFKIAHPDWLSLKVIRLPFEIPIDG
jgi:hypothetical protein